MKSKFMKDAWGVDRIYIECRCGSLEHSLIFEKDMYEGDGYDSEISVYISNNPHLNFWGRLKCSFKYLFKKQYNYVSDDVLIDKFNIEQLQEWIDSIKVNIPFNYCVACGRSNLVTFYDVNRVGTELDRFRYRCLDCGTEFEIKDAIK